MKSFADKEVLLHVDNCKVNNELFKHYCVEDNNTISGVAVNDGVSTKEDAITIKIDCDTKDAVSNINSLSKMLDKVNKQLDEMIDKLIYFKGASSNDHGITYNNCTFLYGKYGRAEVYNECSDINQEEKVCVEDNENANYSDDDENEE